jgi:hypothetical protein
LVKYIEELTEEHMPGVKNKTPLKLIRGEFIKEQ